MRKKIPRKFVNKFLKARGWKWLHNVWCDCSWDFIETDHPIRWLYEHIEQGHEPSFDVCHCWDRQVGRDTGEFEYWYKWWTFRWNKKIGNWELIECYQGVDGFEEECPMEISYWHSKVGLPISSPCYGNISPSNGRA